MAGEWDVVESKPLSEWDVVSVAPAGSGRPGGDIPGAEGELARRAANRAAYREPTLGERAKGAVEWALEMVAQATGGTAGAGVGLIRGLAGAKPTGEFGPVGGADDLERVTAEGAAQGADVMRRGMRQLGIGPGDPGANSPEGQRYIDATGEFLSREAPGFIAGPLGLVGMGSRTGAQNARRAVGDVAGAVVDRGLQAVTPEIAPAKAALAKTATDAGIPLNVHQVLDNKFARLAGEASENVPMSGSKRKQRQQAFNNGLARAIDPELGGATHLTPEVYDAAMTKAGEAIGEISARTPIPGDALSDIASVARRDTPDIQAVVKTYADDIAKVAADNGGVLPGETFRELRSQASRQARTTPNGDLRRALGDVIKKMDDALSEHAAEGDMETLVDARRRYAIGSTLAPLVAKTTDGNISPAALMGAVTRDSAGKTRMARGRGGELGEYAKIGQAFLKEVGTSNTSERNLVYRALTDAVTAGKIVAAYPFAAAYNLLGPKVAKWMIDREARRAAPVPERAPPEPGLAQGFEDVPQGGPPAGAAPLGDLTPDWETTPGAGAPRAEGLDAAGLTPALGDEAVTTGPRKDLRAGLQIPAVEGRPDLPDTMVAGPPAELGADAPTGAAMQAPDAALARQQQLAEVERLRTAAPQSPEVQKVLDAHAARVKAATLRAENAKALRDAAGMAKDPEIAAALRKRADALEKAEPVPAGDAKELKTTPTPAVKTPKKIAAGDATEIVPERIELGDEVLPVGDATEITPDLVEAPDGKRLESDPVRPPAGEEGLPEGGGAPAGGEKAQGAEGTQGGKDLSLDFPRIDEGFMELQQRAQAEKKGAPSDRNLRAVRKVLEEGMAEGGGLDKDGAALALWALDKNPNLAHDLLMHTPSRVLKDVELGSYDSAKKIITIFKGTDNSQTAVHEILHHSERMMPPEVQQGIRKEWERAYEKALREAEPDQAKALQNARKAARGDARALDRMKKDFQNGVLDIDEHYHLVNPTEFWAVNGARILHERFTGRGSWRAQAVQWLREMVEHVKNIAGVRSDSAILKALNEVLDPKRTTGEQRSPTQIRGVSNRPDLATGPPKDQP